MFGIKRFTVTAVASALLGAAVVPAYGVTAVDFDPFVIRNGNVTGLPPAIVENGTGNGVTVSILDGGQKAGYGTHAFDNQALSSVPGVSYTRGDAGDKAPYVNIWITNGAGKFAVIAPMANMMAGGGYTSNDINGLNMQSLGFNIYETDMSDLSWLGIAGAQRMASALMHADGTPVLVSEIGSLLVADPGTYPSPIGTGAPKNGTGFNLIFGDTQGNFVTPVPYVIDNVAVPEPGTMALIGLPLVGLLGRRRK